MTQNPFETFIEASTYNGVTERDAQTVRDWALAVVNTAVSKDEDTADQAATRAMISLFLAAIAHAAPQANHSNIALGRRLREALGEPKP